MPRWALRAETGTVMREQDRADVTVTSYGYGASASTRHRKSVWIETDDGRKLAASMANTADVSASPGDRVRIIFAEPGSHVVGLRNESLGQNWKWRFPAASGASNLALLLLATGLMVAALAGVYFLFSGQWIKALICLGGAAFIVMVPLGPRRRHNKAIVAELDRLLATPVPAA